jgi:hypothetical protein
MLKGGGGGSVGLVEAGVNKFSFHLVYYYKKILNEGKHYNFLIPINSEFL